MKSILASCAILALSGTIQAKPGGFFSRARQTLDAYFDTCGMVKFAGNNCAVIFDGVNCGGWRFFTNMGYTDLPWVKDNKAESVMVRPGCTFKGTAHD